MEIVGLGEALELPFTGMDELLSSRTRKEKLLSWCIAFFSNQDSSFFLPNGENHCFRDRISTSDVFYITPLDIWHPAFIRLLGYEDLLHERFCVCFHDGESLNVFSSGIKRVVTFPGVAELLFSFMVLCFEAELLMSTTVDHFVLEKREEFE